MNQKRGRRPGRAQSQQAPKLTKSQRRQLRQHEQGQQEQFAEMRSVAKRRIIKRVIGWSGVLSGLILLVLALIYFTDRPKPEAAIPLTRQTPNSSRTLGNPGAPITLVEFSDYQCPRCAVAHYIIKKLVKELGEDFHLIFRHYPLRKHEHAQLAARSAEAAGRQGKFWEMHDLLFSRQATWSAEEKEKAERTFVQYAGSLNLDVEKFQRDLHSQEILDKVANDHQMGHRSGVTGTPTFFLNGQRITRTPRTYEGFKKLIIQSKTNLP